MKAHYIYTKEGVAVYMGYRETRQVNTLIKKAINLGLSPSKSCNGTKLFDVSMLINPELFLMENLASSNSKFIKIISEKRNSCTLLDLIEA